MAPPTRSASRLVERAEGIAQRGQHQQVPHADDSEEG